ncbi:hypothetical protein [Mesorhizobium sp.]|uniref:hypothetical protein n=1 Tax=Mesorhizobium sp. TaxID=1871066 RepID=UPI00121B6E84|nr:hypothetical protein [Mesorhizobium sp.]TIS34367.1 MAG: hypothetical protein E5W95_30835 [Mesorhizobium sp.]
MKLAPQSSATQDVHHDIHVSKATAQGVTPSVGLEGGLTLFLVARSRRLMWNVRQLTVMMTPLQFAVVIWAIVRE